MKEQVGFNAFKKILCVSLPRSIDRREYIKDYFSSINISNYIFIDAVDKDDRVVKDHYKKKLVASYPVCFRCGAYFCNEENCNNILIPQQVATFLSHIKVWNYIKEEKLDTALIVEDDVVFTEKAVKGMSSIFNKHTFSQLSFYKNSEVLLRLGWAKGKEHDSLDKYQFVPDAIRMSNPCYALTDKMARLLIDEFRHIETTVDVFLHRNVAKKVKTYTIFPPIAYEHSHSTGKFPSLIHPKKERINYLKSHNGESSVIRSENEKLNSHLSHVIFIENAFIVLDQNFDRGKIFSVIKRLLDVVIRQTDDIFYFRDLILSNRYWLKNLNIFESCGALYYFQNIYLVTEEDSEIACKVRKMGIDTGWSLEKLEDRCLGDNFNPKERQSYLKVSMLILREPKKMGHRKIAKSVTSNCEIRYKYDMSK